LEITAQFNIQFSQYLAPDGAATQPLPDFAEDVDQLIRMYRMMSVARIFDGKAINLQRTGKLGTYPSCLGHEASHVGVAAAMRDDDSLAISYRELGSLLWRGVTMLDILLYWGGDERGSDWAGPAHDFPVCIPIATQCLHAAGAAMAFQYRGEDRCGVAMIGDGGTSEGCFYEAINLAGAKRLPAVFVVVNNKWALSVPLSAQTASETLAQKAIAAGMPAIQVDGNDVIAVRHWTQQALERARRGEGPTLIEALTYRLGDHTTADDARRYRGDDEVARAGELEPLIRLRTYLMNIGAWREQDETALKEGCANKIDQAVESYVNTQPQPVAAMFDHLFEQPTERLEAQKLIAKRYAGSNTNGHG
jgi:pyruvate dehydrogenase E1 component alpha subunit